MSKLSDADIERIATRIAEKLTQKPRQVHVNADLPSIHSNNIADLLAELERMPGWGTR